MAPIQNYCLYSITAKILAIHTQFASCHFSSRLIEKYARDKTNLLNFSYAKTALRQTSQCVCHLWRLLHYDICRIMMFVALWRLSLMTVVALWRLSHYEVCRSLMFVVYYVCRIMMFVALWCLLPIMTFVAYRACRSIDNWAMQSMVLHPNCYNPCC